MQKITYDSLVNEHGSVQVGEYLLKAVGKDFLTLVKTSYDDNAQDLNGWKFHISLDESNEEKLKLVFELLTPILMENGVSIAKFKKVGRALDNESHPSEHGRQITIYATPGINWKALLEAITIQLIELEIPPGSHSTVCKRVIGSNYISYRNDLDSNGEYIPCRQAHGDDDILAENKYNPGEVPDPFTQLVLEVDNQLEQPLNEGGGDNESCCCRIQ